MAHAQPCDVVAARGRLDLAIDRRKKPTHHVDPTVWTLAFRERGNGQFVAAVLNYGMHTVSLGHVERQVQRSQHGDALRYPAAEVTAGLPPDEGAGGDKDAHVDAVIARARALLGDGFRTVFDAGLADMLADIRGDLAEFGVNFDRWYSEQALGNGKDGGPIDRALRRLRKRGTPFSPWNSIERRLTSGNRSFSLSGSTPPFPFKVPS